MRCRRGGWAKWVGGWVGGCVVAWLCGVWRSCARCVQNVLWMVVVVVECRSELAPKTQAETNVFAHGKQSNVVFQSSADVERSCTLVVGVCVRDEVTVCVRAESARGMCHARTLPRSLPHHCSSSACEPTRTLNPEALHG
jgi:hypothetical protein